MVDFLRQQAEDLELERRAPGVRATLERDICERLEDFAHVEVAHEILQRAYPDEGGNPFMMLALARGGHRPETVRSGWSRFQEFAARIGAEIEVQQPSHRIFLRRPLRPGNVSA